MRKLPAALVAERIDYSAYRIHDGRVIMPRAPGFGLKLEGRGRGRPSVSLLRNPRESINSHDLHYSPLTSAAGTFTIRASSGS